MRGSTLIIPHGVEDQRSVEERQDVLVYTSDPLQRNLEITGPISVWLFASSTAWTPISPPSWWTCAPTATPTTFRTGSSGAIPVFGQRARADRTGEDL